MAFAFSNAFFEHLYRSSRGPHLQRIREALAPDGACCYMGIPYFRNIARLYLERGPGTAGPVFDLFNVYRYTHGNPKANKPGGSVSFTKACLTRRSSPCCSPKAASARP